VSKHLEKEINHQIKNRIFHHKSFPQKASIQIYAFAEEGLLKGYGHSLNMAPYHKREGISRVDGPFVKDYAMCI
jgi:uncharacterized protein YifE (UPF0438 family)